MATGTERKKTATTQIQTGEAQIGSQDLSKPELLEETTENTQQQNAWQPSITRWSWKRSEASADRRASKSTKVAHGLGWLSVGLGLAEIIAPRKLANLIGVRRSKAWVIRWFGLRELASGISIFAGGRRPARGVWSRVAGDAVDLVSIGAAFTSPSTRRGKLALVTANVAAVTAVDFVCASKLTVERNGNRAATTTALKSIIINRSPEDLYHSWHQFENLPRYLNNLKSVETTGPAHSHWVAHAPAGAKIEWDAEITVDRPNQHIEWHSLSGADIQNYGSVRFQRAPGDRGTIVHLELHYNLPGGKFGSALARLFGHDPGQRAMEALRRFKQVMETGDIIVSEGTLYENGLLTQRPAQPVGNAGETPEYARTSGYQAPPRQSTKRTDEEHES